MATVRIDDISAIGTELPDDELAGLAGGRARQGTLSSRSGDIGGSIDLDQDF
jgi:putative ATP-grasp target RiPP